MVITQQVTTILVLTSSNQCDLTDCSKQENENGG